MARKTKVVRFDEATADEREAMADWLYERICEMAPEEDSINAEYGDRFMATLRGLEGHLR